MNKNQNTFINKYKPYFLDDFYMNENLYDTIKSFLDLDYMQILFVGNPCSGKTSLLNTLIREYYNLDKNSNFPENNIISPSSNLLIIDGRKFMFETVVLPNLLTFILFIPPKEEIY